MNKCKPLLLKISKREKQEEKYYDKIIKTKQYKVVNYSKTFNNYLIECVKFGCKKKKITLEVVL